MVGIGTFHRFLSITSFTVMMSCTTNNWVSDVIMPNLLLQFDPLERSYAVECGKQQDTSLLAEIFKDKHSEAISEKRKSDKHFFQCSICEKLFTQAGNLKRHIENIHCNKTRPLMSVKTRPLMSVKTRLYQCDICEKSFSTKQGVKGHERIHTGERPYKCSYCEKSYKTWSTRYTHELGIHAKAKRHSCVKCGKKFLFPSMLKIHMKTHNETANYENSIIETNNSHMNLQKSAERYQRFLEEKYFKESNKKNKHVESINNDVGPHKCFLCQKTFKQLHHLESHWITHTTEPNLFQFGFQNTNLEIIEIELLI